MARFELHKTFRHPKESELIASADRLSEVIRAWEDDSDAAFGYVVLNTEIDEIVWRPESVAVFPAPSLWSLGARSLIEQEQEETAPAATEEEPHGA